MRTTRWAALLPLEDDAMTDGQWEELVVDIEREGAPSWITALGSREVLVSLELAAARDHPERDREGGCWCDALHHGAGLYRRRLYWR